MSCSTQLYTAPLAVVFFLPGHLDRALTHPSLCAGIVRTAHLGFPVRQHGAALTRCEADGVFGLALASAQQTRATNVLAAEAAEQ